MSRLLDKVVDINHSLETDLREANHKIVELEKDIQKLNYMEIKHNLCKIK
jgi:hypothetical protein